MQKATLGPVIRNRGMKRILLSLLSLGYRHPKPVRQLLQASRERHTGAPLRSNSYVSNNWCTRRSLSLRLLRDDHRDQPDLHKPLLVVTIKEKHAVVTSLFEFLVESRVLFERLHGALDR